jgi:hypothetical protein
MHGSERSVSCSSSGGGGGGKVPNLSKIAIFQTILDRMNFFYMITTINISTKIMVICKYKGGKTVSEHDKRTTALKYPPRCNYELMRAL